MLKKNGGITLIALVITIIVLLILAGVSIAMLSGDNGLLTRSTDAAAKEKIAGAKDVITTEIASMGADWYESKYVTGGESTESTTAYIDTKLSDSNVMEGINDKIGAYDCTATYTKIDTTKTPNTDGSIEVTLTGSNIKAKGTIKNGKIEWEWK